MKAKTLNFIISLEVYPFDVMVSIGESRDTVIKKLSKKLFKKDREHLNNIRLSGNGKSIMFGSGQSLLWINRMPTDPFSKGVLSHEVFHIVEFIMNRIGMRLSRKSDEAYAYLIQYLTNKIYQKL